MLARAWHSKQGGAQGMQSYLGLRAAFLAKLRWLAICIGPREPSHAVICERANRVG